MSNTPRRHGCHQVQLEAIVARLFPRFGFDVRDWAAHIATARIHSLPGWRASYLHNAAAMRRLMAARRAG